MKPYNPVTMKPMSLRLCRLSLLLLLSALFSGCASTAQPRDAHDPFEGLNRKVYKFNEKVDKYLMKPVAKGYDKVMPKPVDRGIDNVISNLGDVLVFVNDLFQLKLTQAVHDSSRVIFNTTLGLGGLIDIASSIGLEKHNEDFGQTLGYWGVPDGPYLVLPFLGPSTLRDGVGLIPDGYVNYELQNAVGLNDTDEKWTYTGLVAINVRQDLLGAEDVLNNSGADPYLFLRELYLQRRRALILDGQVENIEDELSDEEEDALFGDVE